jgi:hypothetical protein
MTADARRAAEGMQIWLWDCELVSERSTFCSSLRRSVTKTDGPVFIVGEAYQNDTAALPCYIDSIEIDDNSRWLSFEVGVPQLAGLRGGGLIALFVGDRT